MNKKQSIRQYIDKFKVSRDYAENMAREQAKNWYKILQPDDPRYKAIYGKQEARQKEKHEKQIKQAADIRQERNERGNYTKKSIFI